MLVYFVIAIIGFIIYVKWRHSYWTRRGVMQVEPPFFIIQPSNLFTRELSFAKFVETRYNIIKSFNQRGGGSYFLLEPVYYATDPSLIKQIMQTDFTHFTDHGLFHHPKDILSMNIFNLEGETWKTLRAKLTPTFTSGKIKMMFATLIEKTVGLEKLVQKCVDTQEAVEVKDVLSRFTTDIIGSCAFGIECNSLEDPDDYFRRYGGKAFKFNLFRSIMGSIFPWNFLGNMGYKSNDPEVTEFFTKIVKDTIKTRETNHIVRMDFMHLLLQLKKKYHDNNTQKTNNEGDEITPYTITENEIIAQCFVFFFAGFETSSTAMTFALLELSQNTDIQDKLREEINQVLNNYDDQLTYDAIMEMSYLDKVVNESLRKYPPAPAIPRVCTKDYKIPGTNSVIEKGCRVNIPVWGLHRDPEYYPDPERFDPERFSEENKLKRPDFTFLPFGEGPRLCIGMRFGLLQTKVGLVSLLRNFKFSLNKKTPIPIQLSKGSFIISVEGEIWLNVTRVEGDYF